MQRRLGYANKCGSHAEVELADSYIIQLTIVRANVPVERQQSDYNTRQKTLNCQLQQGCYAAFLQELKPMIKALLRLKVDL